MAEMIKVRALRPHRNGYAPAGRVAKGDEFAVPVDRLAAMQRSKLVKPVLPPAPRKPVRADDENSVQG
jgi:hypothetical protein